MITRFRTIGVMFLIALAPFMIVPIPLHASTLKAEDYSQSRADEAPAATHLGLAVTPALVTLVNYAGVTCAQSPVAPLRLSLGKLALQWNGTAPLEGATVVVAFQSSGVKGGQYICTIAGQEFDAVFGTQNASVAKSIQSLSGCSLQCGGIELVNAKASFQAAGSVTVFGLTQVGTIGHVQQQASAPITVEFNP